MAIQRRKVAPSDSGEGASSAPSSGLRRLGRPGAGGVFRKSSFALSGELANVINAYNKDKSYKIIRPASELQALGRVRLGVFILDLALGGGLALSKTAMFYGEKSAGKTTLALMAVARTQRMFPDRAVIWIDIEGTLDKNWARKLGVDLDRLIIVEPETGEEAVDLADGLLRANETSMVVTDSIAMLIPMKEIEGSAEDSLPGVHARLVGNYIRRVNNALLTERHRGRRPIVLHINQFRMKIGVMFGDPRTLPGGKALEFATSQQVLVSNKEKRVEKGDNVGIVSHNEHSFQITKDKTGGRLKEGTFILVRESELMGGLPEAYVKQTKTILTWAERAGLVSSGAGGSYDLGKYGKLRGEDRVTEFFVKEPQICEALQIDTLKFFQKKWDISQ
jgi:recombination protein RecA